MTEQTKIPTPSADGGKDRTLIERAGDALGLGSGFKPAPVPRELAEGPNRRNFKGAGKAAPRQKAPTETFADVPAAPPNSPPSEAAPDVRAPVEELDKIEFPSLVHPVDRGRLRQLGLLLPEGPVSALLEEFRIVKRQILLAARDGRDGKGPRNAQRVLVCSPLPGEGKTYCAANLALAIAAEKDTEVLLVDADFAKPSILSTLGLPGGNGLMDALANQAIAVEDCVLATDIPGLFVLPAGNQTTTDSEFLSSERTPALLDRLTQGAPNRIVIFDSPPALAASPAAELAKHVGQALVVVRAHQTGQTALEDTISLLSACPDIKLLLNAAFFSPSGRRFGTYYGYEG